MTDSTGVTAVASASSPPDPFTRTARPGHSEFLPVLRELSSSGPHRAETRAPDSAREGQPVAPHPHDDVEGDAAPADEAIAPR